MKSFQRAEIELRLGMKAIIHLPYDLTKPEADKIKEYIDLYVYPEIAKNHQGKSDGKMMDIYDEILH